MSLSTSKSARELLDGTLRTLLAEALFIPTGILTTALLARYLSPAGFGLFTLAATSIAWIEWTITSLFSRAVIKFVSETKEWRPIGSTVLRLYLAAGIVAAALVCLFAGVIADAFNEPSLALYLRLFALDIPIFTLTQAHRNILLGIGDFKRQALSSATRWASRLLLIALLLVAGFSINGAILGSIASSLVALLVSLRYARPSVFRRSGFRARNLWSYGATLLLVGLSMRLYDKLDLYMLKALGGTAAEAGFYGAAQNLSLMPGFFAFSFTPLLLSTLGRALRDGDLQTARNISRNSMRLALWLLPLAGITAGTAFDIVRVIYGVEFAPAAPLLSVLIFGAVAFVLISVGMTILIAAGRPRLTLLLAAPLPFVAVCGHLLLIPRWGMLGASVVTLFAESAGAAATAYAVYRCRRILPPARTLARSLLVCALAFALAFALPQTASAPLVLLKLTALTFLVVLVFLCLGEFDAGELALARSLLRWRAGTDAAAPREV